MQLVPRLEQAADMRLDARQLGYMVDCLVDGGYATDYFLDNDRIDLVIKGDDRFVKRTQDLRTLPVITPGGQLVPLDSVAEVREFSSGPEQILHRERERAITVQVSPPPRMPLEEAQERIQALVVKPLATRATSRRATGSPSAAPPTSSSPRGNRCGSTSCWPA